MQLPETFIQRTRAILPEDEYTQLEQALDLAPPVSIRINPLKICRAVPDLEAVPWCGSGYYLPRRPAYTFDPLLHAGGYYVQEASSMFLEQVLRQYVDSPVRYLDLCAAPGGKSTLAAAVLPAGSLIVSNEIVRNRAQVLVENVVKWGNPNGVVTHNAPAAFSLLTHYFDVIQTDVPCSGEGMFRKDPDSVSEWSVENVALCAERQRNILSAVWNALRPGGLLIYSTCTYNLEENEWNIRFLQEELGAELLPVETKDEWQIRPGLAGVNPVYRFMPHLTKGEGFFMAVVRKPAGEAAGRDQLMSSLLRQLEKKGNPQKGKGPALLLPKEIGSWISGSDRFRLVVGDEAVSAIPMEYERDIRLLGAVGHVLRGGIRLARLKGREFVPDQELALSVALNRDAFQQVEVDWKQAVAYLRREAIGLPVPDKGYLLLTYRGLPLGWVKNLGSRANNLYPQEWRIRSGYLPETFSGLEIG